jgi:hypothetical protein
VTLDGVGTEVAFAPAPLFPAVLAGVPILALFRAWHDRYWWSRLLPRTSYEPFGMIVLRGRADDGSSMRSDPEESLPVGDDAGMVTTQPNGSPAASHTPEVRDEQRATESSASARQPVSPPTFETRRGGEPSSRPPGNRRKSRRRGGAR